MPNFIKRSAYRLAQAADGEPAMTTLVVMMFYIMLNVLSAILEKVIFGEMFTHWLDAILALAHIAYAAYAVYACAIYNSGRP